MEPFGEVREDMRMARLLHFYYDAKRGKKGRAMPISEFMMYNDERPQDEDPASEVALLRALSRG